MTRAKEIITTSKVSFRHFTFLMNSVANTGYTSPEILKFIEDHCIESLTTSVIQDHYLIKALSLFQNNRFLELGIAELMNKERLPFDHPNDLSRAFVLLCENQNLQNPEIINHFRLKIPKTTEFMKPKHIARFAYSLAKINKGEPKDFKLLEKKMLENDLTRLMPLDLGISCLGFGLVGMNNFCLKALSAVNDCFHKYQKREYDDYSDTDQDDIISNKLVLVNEQDLDFTSEIPASAVVQMA